MTCCGPACDEDDILRLLMANVPSMLAYWDRNLICRYANAAYRRWFGVEPTAVVGASLRDLLGADLFALNEPHIRGALAGEPQLFERTIVGRDGVARESLAHYLPHVVDGDVLGFMALVSDIEPCKRREAELRYRIAECERRAQLLRQREQELRDAQWMAQAGEWEWEADSQLLTWTESIYRIFGLDASRLPPGLPDHAALYTPGGWRRLRARLRRAMRDAVEVSVTVPYRRADGTHGWIEVRGAPVIDADGRRTGLRGRARDVSERRRIEALIAANREGERALAELQAARQRIAELERAVAHADATRLFAQLSSGIAHDFNSVLGAISTSLQVLERAPSPAMAARSIRRGHRGVERAGRLVRQLVALGSGANGEPATLTASQAMRGARELIRMAAGPAVKVEWSIDTNWSLRVEPHRLEVALLNLALNARDALRRGGRLRVSVVQAEAGTVLGSAVLGRDHVLVTVEDDGAGMAPDTLAKAGTPFFTTKPPGRGSGLGLMMVELFARDAGGRLVVDSEQGRGTRAVIALPRAR